MTPPAPTQSAKSGSCGCAPTTATAEMDAKLRARIESHPCYSEDAHHHFARMHVAVAPACNIQCNYCNRKFDCANESRPGVVSELLTPEEAAHKVLVIAGKIPQMSVLGIAGPGDPLANPKQTFRTFELVAEQAPDIKLCLSTNGLMLPDHVERIKQLNIDHVTITINMIDPEIGAKIYPWIRYNRRRYTGIEAARILHERQMEGLEALRDADILCKVNSVLIPGINDEHLVEVNKAIRDRGAFLHNIMPLISAPEHGTHFGLTGQRGPTQKELKFVQDNCSGNMKMMRHCRQCRADAVGLLGEDRSQEFTKDKFLTMEPEYNLAERQVVHQSIAEFKAELARAKAAVEADRPVVENSPKILVAVTTKGSGLINQHFGHAKEFQVYEVDANEVRFVSHRKIDHYCQGGYGEAATLDNIMATIADCAAVLTAKIGTCPQDKLATLGVEAVEAYDAIETVARQYYDRKLSEQLATSQEPVAVAP